MQCITSVLVFQLIFLYHNFRQQLIADPMMLRQILVQALKGRISYPSPCLCDANSATFLSSANCFKPRMVKVKNTFTVALYSWHTLISCVGNETEEPLEITKATLSVPLTTPIPNILSSNLSLQPTQGRGGKASSGNQQSSEEEEVNIPLCRVIFHEEAKLRSVMRYTNGAL